MSQLFSSDKVVTRVPSVLPDVTVQTTPTSGGTIGIVAIVGEAAGGAPFGEENIEENFFSIDQIGRIAAKYESGPIVDAARALSAPANDVNIAGSVSRIYIVKTNSSVQAALNILTAAPSSYGDFKALNHGLQGSQIALTSINVQAETAPAVTGSDLVFVDGSAYSDKVFGIRQNGELVTTITLSAVNGDHDDLSKLVIEINALLPADMTASADGLGLKIEIDVDSDPNSKGWGKSFELIDTMTGELAQFGHVEALVSSSTEVQNQTTVTRTSTGTNESFIAGGEIGLNIGYDGTTATLSISSAGVLSTTIVGGSGANLSINLSEFTTMSELADFINSQTGYTAAAGSVASQLAPSSLDQVSTVGIAVTDPTLKSGKIKFDAFDYSRKANESSVVSFIAAAKIGLPAQFAAANAKQFLAGGLKGSTSAAAVSSAIDELEKVKLNFVIPLFSRDATLDISDGFTDSASTYSINAIHAATRSHILRMSTIKLRRFRNGFVAIDDTFSVAKDTARSLASHRMSLSFQKTKGLNSQSQISTFGSWHTASIAAGMTAAGLQRSITHKVANVSGIVDPSDFSSGSQGDLDSALEAGLLIMEQESGSFRFVSDQTSYSFDSNFFFNSGQAVYTADILADDLANALDKAFVGGSTADITAQSVVTFVQAKMNEYLRRRLISTSDDAVAGFKGLRVTINGPVLEVSVEIKLSTTIFFIPLNIEISQVTQSAEG